MIVKYIVMECHEAYAVLMDEESRFVNAANLGYTVGQTVTDPVLMDYGVEETRRKHRIIMTVATAAACLTIICGSGYYYYATNYKTYSTVIISSDAGVKMNLNRKGKVISLESTSPQGAEILSDYSGKGKDKNDAISDILEIGLSKGYINDGETVSVYISDKGKDSFDSLRKELENALDEHSLKADVQPMEDYTTAPATETAGEPVQPAHEPSAPVTPATPDNDKPALPPAPDKDSTAPAVTPPQPPQSEPVSPPLPGKPDDPKPEATAPGTPQPPTAVIPPEDAPTPDKPNASKPETPVTPDSVRPPANDIQPHKNAVKSPPHRSNGNTAPEPTLPEPPDVKIFP